jgi:hypothetical protein
VSEYVSKYAVCPYYHRHKDNRICCEGTDTTNTIHLVFEDRKKLKEHEKQYCNEISGYPNCLLCRALDSKYPK